MTEQCKVCKARLPIVRGLCAACYAYCRRTGLIKVSPKARRDKEAVKRALEAK